MNRETLKFWILPNFFILETFGINHFVEYFTSFVFYEATPIPNSTQKKGARE